MGLLFIGIIVLATMWRPLLGVFPFGPTENIQITVNRLYVDRGSEESHYMVGSDKGVFEVNNSWIAGVWNADELYSRLEEGKTYNITTKGRKIVGPFTQFYPGITRVEKL